MIDYAALDSAVGHNWYELDPDLQRRVERDAPADDLEYAKTKLHDLGALIGGPIARNAEVIDAHPPRLVRYDRWANEIGEVEHHPATLESKRALWQAGYVSGFAADEKKRGRPAPGVVHAGSSYLLAQADTGMVCSLGMTGGVAGLVAAYAPGDVRDQLLSGLRADDLDSGTDGSMFLTERDGGSDLGRTVHCSATDIGDGRVLITGEKWFCSNIDGAAIVMLARPDGAPEGPQGLGLYLVPKYKEDGSHNDYVLRRLKDKLGTKSVPTGEVEFRGALGYALRGRGNAVASSDAGGLNRMMEMVNGSRFGVAMMGLGIARRAFLESAIWAHHREAKGRLLVDLPLVREQLVDLLVDLEGAIALGFECGVAGRWAGGDGAKLRRILVPAAKNVLCRFGVEAASFAVDLHGGNGYCEDWGLTRQLRDAVCHPIWEGSENICALDVLRAVRRDGAHAAALDRIDQALESAGSVPGADLARAARTRLSARFDAVGDDDSSAARLTWLFSRTIQAALLLEQAPEDPHKRVVAERFCRRHFDPESLWEDDTPQRVGRELLAFAEL